METKRKAHVKRIFQMVDKDGNVTSDSDGIPNMDFWFYVLRIDWIIIMFTGLSKEWKDQQIAYKLLWNDDKNNPAEGIDSSKADGQFENANAKRTTKQLFIHDPGVEVDDPPDPLLGSNLWIVEKMEFKLPQGRSANIGIAGQLVNLVFDNVPLAGDDTGKLPAKRTTSVINIVSNDLDHLVMTNEADVEDISQITAYMIDWEVYKQALIAGTIDTTDLHLIVEFVDKFTIRFQAELPDVLGQQIVYVLGNNKYIEDLFNQGSLDEPDADGKPAVLRLDPFQVIVNAGVNITAVEFDEKN